MFEKCEFCGGEAIVVPAAGNAFHVCCVSRDGCKMTGPAEPTMDGAVASWRTIQAAIRDARDNGGEQ